MGKKEKKKKAKSKGGALKQLFITVGVAVAVILVAVVVINAINKSAIKYITVEGAYKELYVGNPEFGVAEVGVSVYPESANTDNLVAYSSNSDVAKVSFNDGKLKIEAVSVGSATIEVRHASKSKLKDYIQIDVKDVDIQDLDFVSLNSEGETVKVESIDVKKDGFEHFIKFDLNPIDANMNNLKVSYDQTVLENAYIDQSSRSLVVVPKTDIVQTSTAVDVEIYQNTALGYVVAQYTRLQLNLKAREAYLRFNLSSDPSKGYSLNHTNIIYLEPDNAPNVYVKPDIGYDVNFTSIGTFNIAEYNVYIDGDKINFNSNAEFLYNNKLKINKGNGNYYYFEVLNDFEDGDNIYVTFEHIFTGVTNNLQFIYLATESIGLSTDQTFSLETKEVLELNEVVALNFSYDNGVKYKVVEIYAFEYGVDANGKQIRIQSESFGDEINDETIVVQKVSDKIFLKATKLSAQTIIFFGIECDYWDSRYVRFSIEDLFVTGRFKVVNSVSDLVVEQNGEEISSIEMHTNSTASVNVAGLPYGNNNLNLEQVELSVSKGGSSSETKVGIISFNGVTVSYNYDTKKFDIFTDLTASGVYEVWFTFNSVATKIFIEVR